MSTATPECWQIQIVNSLDESGPEARIEFVDGRSAASATSHPDWPVIRQWLLFSVRQRCPIAVLTSADDRLSAAGSIERNEVAELADNPRLPNLVDVTLRGSPAPVHLAKSHPRFAELLEALALSQTTRRIVWCVIQGSSIADVKVFAPDEDESLCRWLRESAAESA
jgi:hypothetical protein